MMKSLLMLPRIGCLLLLAAATAGADAPQTTPQVYVHRAMGTEFTFTIYPRKPGVVEDLQPVVDEAFQAVDALELQISSWLETSDTNDINQRAAVEAVSVRPDLFDLIEYSVDISRQTAGAFDVTVGPLVDVWRASLAEKQEPAAAVVAEAVKRVGYDKLELDAEEHTVHFKVEGMRLDFGGIGKGMALDKAEHILRRYGIKSALLSGGDSSMVAIGAPPGKENWRIGIDNPYNKEDRLGFVSLRDESLSTSACYHFRAGSTEDRPCGIFDPRTGWGVTDMLSATVVAPTGTQTDALSTAFYVMGLEKAREFCANHPEVRAVLVEQPEDGLPEPVKINWAKETN